MGLFDFNKPGPGIDKDAPKKKGIFLYFEIFGRKISKLFSLSMLYFLCSIPMMLIYFFAFLFEIPVLANMFSVNVISPEHNVLLSSLLTIVCTIAFGTGPASASMAYILREHSREQHVWLFSSFFDKIKENFKKEIVIFLIDLVFVLLATFAISFYFRHHLATGSILYFVLFLVMLMASIIFMMMHYYIHQLIVTFENTLGEVYKNAFLLTLSTPLPCILLTAFILVLNYFLFSYVKPAFAILFNFLFLLSFFRFPVEFYVNSAIKRIIPKEEEDTSSVLQGSEE